MRIGRASSERAASKSVIGRFVMYWIPISYRNRTGLDTLVRCELVSCAGRMEGRQMAFQSLSGWN
jgi:hypothetical protein